MNQPLAECLHNYFKLVKCGSSGFEKSNTENVYLAKAYVIVTDSMLELDENDEKDQEKMQVYMNILQRLDFLQNYSEFKK